MTWNIEFLKEAEKDLNDLDGSVKKQVLKGIQKSARILYRTFRVVMASRLATSEELIFPD